MLVMAAAVADYRPRAPAAQKLKKRPGPLRLELERTADILGDLRGRAGDRVMVGFAAETENVIGNAERKLRSKGVDLIVANDVARADAGFEVDTNAVVLIDAAGRTDVPLASKEEVAERILDRAVALRRARRAAAERPPAAMARPRSARRRR
jgi:phosphopantothenoylcysteine decarboxylase/phosphopantothenate--cysteine ligase